MRIPVLLLGLLIATGASAQRKPAPEPAPPPSTEPGGLQQARPYSTQPYTAGDVMQTRPVAPLVQPMAVSRDDRPADRHKSSASGASRSPGSLTTETTPVPPALDARSLDRNRDGVVSREEAAAQPELSREFLRLDRDKDGTLDRGETAPRRRPRNFTDPQ